MEPTQNSSSSIPFDNSHFYPQSWLNSYHNHNNHHPPSMFFHRHHHNFNLNNNDDDEVVEEQQGSTVDNNSAAENPNQNYPFPDQEKEPMFEKPLTPSDVGKLNRLVIPKQHAEKYFPLGGDSGDKGLLLSFEDESGKCWRFRYSYWNSSQSYVLTKGWSRYVKEKQLDAGDIILFQRHRRDGDRGLYHPYLGHIQGHGANVPYQPDCLHAGGNIVQNQAAGGANPRRLVRLFGVNLECQLDESEPSTPDSSSVSSQGPTHQQFYSNSYTSNYMDITFSRDMKQMRNHQG
ncbi:hypothetical protein COLO4_29660 [Corchorus olitorius]|uniref:TF-B3 domain-containing protein n=1 Tax=Corchorus olitorius TaxID=93759 RepID=A0A1R3HDN9_9ROSI|nr:hypothetical protein COLO4_29660 [Corchorus olitorius]